LRGGSIQCCAFYADKTGLHPALAGKIRLRDDI